MKGNEVKVLKEAHDDKLIESIIFSLDGKLLVSGGCDNEIRIWDLSEGKEIKILTRNNNCTSSLAISPNGKLLFSGTLDGTMHLWDIQSGKEIATFIPFSDGEWVIITPEGYYKSSLSGEKYIKVSVGSKIYV